MDPVTVRMVCLQEAAKLTDCYNTQLVLDMAQKFEEYVLKGAPSVEPKEGVEGNT